MALNKAGKQAIIADFQRKAGDTASPEVQVAILSKKLEYLTDHFKSNKQDHHSRRGLMKMVGQRRRLLSYLKSKNSESYQNLIAKLGIRK